MVRQRKKARVSVASGASATTTKSESSTSANKNDHRNKLAKAEQYWARFNDDNPYPGFKVNVPSRKNASEAHVQPNPWPEIELRTVHYTIEPKIDWDSLVRFKNVQRSAGGSFSVGDTVFVRPAEDQWCRGDEVVEHWLARILEIRGATPANVYLRVYWLYRPEDLPQGRQPYHGDCELIVSNHMDIIEATMVEDKAPVAYWSEQLDQSDWPAQDQLFFRQSIDFLEGKPKRLSNLRRYCRDKAPCNPDEPFVNCDSCDGWLHARCLEEQAVINAIAQHEPTLESKGRQKNSKKRKRPISSDNHDLTARLRTSANDTIYLTVSDHRSVGAPTEYNVDVVCLLCNTCIEPARNFEMGPDLDNTGDASDNGFDVKHTIEVDPSSLFAQVTPDPSFHTVQDPKRRSPVQKKAKALRKASDIEAVGIEAAKPEPKRRGRPRKKAKASNEAGGAESGGSGPKRRGRPPKRADASREAKNAEAENIEPESHRADDTEPGSAGPDPAAAQISTPQPTVTDEPHNESVFQSGYKSVKKLIWGNA